jgi:hypothetical protein
MLTYFGRGRRPTDGKSFGVLQEVRAYWEALRSDGTLPRRDQLDPRGIAGALENVFLLERIAAGHARIRLAGMQLTDLMGMEVRGMPLTALFEPAARARLTDALEPVFAAPSGLELWLEAERGLGRPALEARMILLPLTGSLGEPSLALGCLAFSGPIGRAPRRFTLAGMVREPLALGQRSDTQDAFAETAAPFVPQPLRGKPNLRLVSSR